MTECREIPESLRSRCHQGERMTPTTMGEEGGDDGTPGGASGNPVLARVVWDAVAMVQCDAVARRKQHQTHRLESGILRDFRIVHDLPGLTFSLRRLSCRSIIHCWRQGSTMRI